MFGIETNDQEWLATTLFPESSLMLLCIIEVHKIFRCSHLISLISHYFSKTIVEKKRIVDIYPLKIFLVLN